MGNQCVKASEPNPRQQSVAKQPDFAADLPIHNPLDYSTSTGETPLNRTNELGGTPSLFAEFSEGEVIDLENGLENLFKAINCDIEGVESLMVAYIFQQTSFTEITKSEFEECTKRLSIAAFSQFAKPFAVELNRIKRSPFELKKLFSYIFKTGKDPSDRNMAIDMAVAVLELLLGTKTPYSGNPLVAKFLTYIQTNRKSMTADEFTETAEFFWKYTETIEDYDEADAWPVLFDCFVEHCQSSE